MELTITRQEVLKIMNRNEIFDIEYCTADKKRGTGGDLVAYNRAVKHTKQELPKKQLEKLEATQPLLRSANKKYHSIINIYLPQIREIRTLHIRLITAFNGKRVI